MGSSSVSFTHQWSPCQGSDVREIRALVAKHFEIDVARVTDEAHFRHDLGARWLDRLELLVRIEDQFPDIEILDEDADRIEVVGDLIRCIEGARRRSPALRPMDADIGVVSA